MIAALTDTIADHPDLLQSHDAFAINQPTRYISYTMHCLSCGNLLTWNIQPLISSHLFFYESGKPQPSSSSPSS